MIIDTAGRLHIDEDMMAELVEIKEAVDGPSDDSGSGCHDRSGCGECGKGLSMKKSESTA